MSKRANGRTRSDRGPIACAVMMGCLTAAPAVPAQEAESVTVDVGECTTLESPEERLACYENRVEAELRRRDSGAGSATEPARPAEAVPPAGAAEPEGLAATSPPAPSPAAAAPPAQTADASASSKAARDEKPAEIVGVIASLRETVPNSYVITLEDGQVWRQTYPERYPLRAGERVTIRPSRWGESYRLAAERLNGYIQVEKVR